MMSRSLKTWPLMLFIPVCLGRRRTVTFCTLIHISPNLSLDLPTVPTTKSTFKNRGIGGGAQAHLPQSVCNMKYTLWGEDVDLDLDKDTFPTERELRDMDDALPGSEHGWFLSTSGAKLHYRQYLPPDGKKPKALCIWQHGIQAHSGIGFTLKNGRKTNYALLSSRMLDAGYALYTPDMLGHGFSEGRRFYIPKGDFKINRDDLDAFSRYVASKHDPDIPLFLMGDSYGCTTALHVARKWQESTKDLGALPPPKSFCGLVLTAPAVVGDIPPAPVVFVLRHVLKPIAPTWTPFFMPNPVSPDRIWSDPEVLALETDPRAREMRINGSGLPFSLGTGAGLLSALESVREETIPGLEVPFCVCHGTDDYAVPIEGTRFLLERSGTKEEDRAVYEVKGAYHDLMSEPTAEDTFSFFMKWIEGRILKGPAF